jgi:hypothetical protein
MAGDAYMLPIIGEMGKLRRPTQTSDILIGRHRYEEPIGKGAIVALSTLILQWTMVSHIPFKIPKPIINIPPMHVTTELVTFTKSPGGSQFYINLVDGCYMGLRERFTEVASMQATTTGKTNPFGRHWRCIRFISVPNILGPTSMDLEISSLRQLW